MIILHAWLRGLVVTAVILGFIELILPDGEIQRFARLALSLLVILVLLQPMISLLQLDLDLDRVLTVPVQPAVRALETGAARVTAAGLSVLAEVRRRETERNVREFCRTLGATPERIEATFDRSGGILIRVHLEDTGNPARLKEAIVAHFALPAAAVEVTSSE